MCAERNSFAPWRIDDSLLGVSDDQLAPMTVPDSAAILGRGAQRV
jgi:hypothetical protein